MLKGEEIPYLARIAAVADTFDAMTSRRSYRGPIDIEHVKDEIKRCEGTQFDPQVAEAFLEILNNNYEKIQEKLNTDISSTHSIPFHSLNPSPLEDAAQLPERKRKEATDAYSVYEEIIKDNIEYDYLIQDRYLDRDRIEEILALILETVCTKRRTIRIAGDDHPAELVKAKFMKLNSEHIRFVLDCMQENTTKIRNIKQYMKAALFNAPSTIGSYYTSLVSHDMYGGRTIQSARSKGIPDYTCNEGESL